MSASMARVPISTLTLGTVLTAPIFDPHSAGTKLLGKNVEVDAHFLEQLSKRGIESVVVDKCDLARLQAGVPQGVARRASDHQYLRTARTNHQTIEIDERIACEGFDGDLSLPSTSVKDRLGPTPDSPYEPAEKTEMLARREAQVEYLDGLFVDLLKGNAAADQTLSNVCRDSVKSITDDRDLFLCLGINPFDVNYPARHSLHVCSLAISIGVMLGLDDASLNDLGTGCLIHDVGMKKMSLQVFGEKRKLTDRELVMLAEHPILTLEALACPGVRISRVARIVAYQIHERGDGSGYPRGRSFDEIHPLARIASVADAYVGLVSNRTHRKAMMPYHAIEKILRDVSVGLFDTKAVRGLLHAISLFPIGSFVQTDDHQIARVVRANGESYDKPVVEFWNPKSQCFQSDLVDLSRESSIRIVRASRSPQAA